MILREFLARVYCEQVRGRQPGQSSTAGEFWIDDQNEDDAPGAFCNIRATLPDDESNEFRLTLYPVPWDRDVETLVDRLGGQWQDIPTGRLLEVPMTARSVPDIRRLARVIRRVTGRGKRYVDSRWKWSTRRTADSLERFARLLAEWNRTGRRMVPEEVPF
jgi:hypothetical protein